MLKDLQLKPDDRDIFDVELVFLLIEGEMWKIFFEFQKNSWRINET